MRTMFLCVSQASYVSVTSSCSAQSDKQRRREYDSLYGTRTRNQRTAEPEADASQSFFNTFASMFGGAAGAGAGQSTGEDYTSAQRPDADEVFGDVFDEVRLHTLYLTEDAKQASDVAP
jgi:DnaJ-class molecular chaperone